jgi:hypothetical protein
MRSLINELSDSYCTISSNSAFLPEPDASSVVNSFRKQIENSKLFICLLNQMYLVSERCMSELKFATRISKKCFILHESKHLYLNDLTDVLNINCKLIHISTSDGKDIERIRHYIDNFLK